MGTLNDISQKLVSGYTVSQLIGEGYAKSSVNHVAKKLKKTQLLATPTSPVEDELQELRHQKEIVKLRKEIADLEAAKEKVPDRLAELEKTYSELRSFVCDAVDSALYVSLKHAGMDSEKAKEYADGWVARKIRD